MLLNDRGRAWLMGRARYLLLGLPLLLSLVYFLTHVASNRYYHQPSPGSGNNDATSFWAEAFQVLERVKPFAAPVRPIHAAPAENWSPDVSHPRENLTVLPPGDAEALRASHTAFVTSLPGLTRHLPFATGTTGIVTTAGIGNFGQVITMLLAVRLAGSTLPVEIVLDSSAAWVRELCDAPVAQLGATCVDIADTWAGVPRSPPMRELRSFQWKSVALLASSFQKVLFLDADTLPVLNPDDIFAPDSEPLASTGMITWPDFWTPTDSPLFYEIAGDVRPPSLAERTSSESGVMVVDKARHGDTLLLALYYNAYGPEYYYPLLSQDGPGQGDKETFLHAAVVLDDLLGRESASLLGSTAPAAGQRARQRFWDVKGMPSVHGRTVKGQWKGMFMQQMDPMGDYRVATQEKSARAAITTRSQTAGSNRAGTYRRRKRTDEPRHTGVLSETSTEAAMIAGRETPGAAYMFFHHNGVKLDFTKVIEKDCPMTARDEQGKYVRLWGDPGWIIAQTDKDIEKELWRAATKLFCEAKFNVVCEIMRDFYIEVF